MGEPDDTNEVAKKTAEDMCGGKGPTSDRGCTDIICIPIFIAHLVLFLIVTMAGMQDGNPSKLFVPRDYQGQYCGVAEQGDWAWGNGGSAMNLEAQTKLTQMMNVTEAVNPIAIQFVCSSAVEAVLIDLYTSNSDEYRQNQLACCKDPAGECTGSFEMQNLNTPADINNVIVSRMTEFTDPSSSGLFSPSGENGDMFGGIWNEVTKYFVKVCTTECGAIDASTSERSYTYDPAPDSPFFPTWRILRTATECTGSNGPACVATEIKSTINNSFTFNAMPTGVCPYAARYCVPFPGVVFSDNAITGDVCMFGMSDAVVGAVGSAATQTFTDLADRVDVQENLGSWWGDFIDTLDAFFITAIMSFIIGIVFLVLLRFFVGACVWLSIVVVFILLVFGGACAWVRSGQCVNHGFFDSATSSGYAVFTVAQVTAQNTIAGDQATSEAMTDTGADYAGVQYRTVSGKTCQQWAEQTPHMHSYSNVSFPAQLNPWPNNYCRNPGGEAMKIWCFTTDTTKRWEVCNPIGILQPECAEGYKVPDETMRTVLEYLAYIIWLLAVLYVLCICCLGSRIRLAIAVNKVAAQFVANTPSVLVVPMIQTVVSILYSLAWAFSAAFLISQVPADYVPSSPFSNFTVAQGVEGEYGGACNDKWPQGFVWKDMGNMASADDPCSGNMGVLALGQVPQCWRCAPPRYAIDYRVGYSFFSFLWNQMLNVALGQFIIAAAVAIWFWTPNDEKGKGLCGKLLKTSVFYAFRFHFGSLCFGSFIIAVVMWIRFFMMYLEQQAKAQQNKVMEYVLKCVQCCIYCFEKCLKFLTKNAYIQIAILGKNFCTSAKNAFKLIGANCIRFAVVSGLGGIIHYIGLIFIMAGTSACGYYILTGLHDTTSPVIPMICYVILSYFIASLYMAVFALAVDSVLQCFIATEASGNASDTFVPSAMRSFFDTNAPKTASKSSKE